MNHSAQREAILAELRSMTCHPTADELHAVLRRRMPQISLGTVYRNLDLLSNRGIVLKLQTAGSQKRFDGCVAPHFHMRCECCDRVFDIGELSCGGQVRAALGQILEETGCFSCQLELTGVCECCKNKEESQNVG